MRGIAASAERGCDGDWCDCESEFLHCRPGRNDYYAVWRRVDACRLHMRGWGNRISSAETWVGAHRAQVFFTFRSKNAHAIGPQVGPNGGPYLPHDDGQGVAVDNYAFMPPRSGSYAFYDTLAAALAHLSGVSRWVKKDNSFRRKVAREAARSKARQVQLHRML